MSRVRVFSTAGFALLFSVSLGVSAVRAADPVPTPDFTQPELTVHEAPTSLTLHEKGKVRLKASPPAAPGATVYLNTAGPYNAGFVRVDETVLDENLTATLNIAGREFLGTFDYWVSLPASGTYQEVLSSRFPIAIVSPAPQVTPACGGTAPLKADGTPWICTYTDEFSGPELDDRYWSVQKTETSGFTSGTRLKYACAWDSPQTVDVLDGNLELSLVDLGESRDCGQNRASRYAYGQVTHHQTYSQTYGKYEIRAKVPDLKVTGSQTSFWLWADGNPYGPWPASGEIDIAEMYSSAPGTAKPFTHYVPGQPTDSPHSNVRHTACPIKVGEFNTYGLVWEPGKITILLNGKVCMINEYTSLVGSPPAPFDHNFFLAMFQAIGSIGNDYNPDEVPDRLTTQVDYVRIWR